MAHQQNAHPSTEAWPFRVDRDPRNRRLLRLVGTVSEPDVRRIELAAVSAMADGGPGVVLDLTAVEATSAALVVALNELGRRSVPMRSVVTLRLPDGHLPDLGDVPLHRAIRVERTADEGAVTDRSPGVGRREGRGFITSFGTGRRCDASGCLARLSRYNERTTCALHSA